ncbi:MAG TPA: hypothetical protein PLT20_14350, partial [Sedimentisphaerales bacterium]|nr:hypothetical protein [Sedimentisphaerales bacterium]
MIEVNFNEVKRRLYADRCTDLLRGVACLRWSLLAGKSYEEAVRPWKKNVPELFTKRDRSTGHRTRQQLPPRHERDRNVRQR